MSSALVNSVVKKTTKSWRGLRCSSLGEESVSDLRTLSKEWRLIDLHYEDFGKSFRIAKGGMPKCGGTDHLTRRRGSSPVFKEMI